MFLKMREKSEKQPTVMRTTAVGNGFVKEDVMRYIDELNVRLLSMEEQNQDLRKELEAARNRIRELENNK